MDAETIVVTAATPWEFRPLERGLGASPLRPGVSATRLGARRLLLVLSGMGAERARRALDGVEASGPGLLAVSSGLAGALQPGIRPADLVADLRGAPLDWVRSARETAETLGLALHLGAFHSAPGVLGPEEKREAGRRLRALAVDMESQAVREWCLARGGSFVATRGVIDGLEHFLPSFPDGARAGRRALHALRRWRELPLLAATWNRQRRAMASLTLFLGRWLNTL